MFELPDEGPRPRCETVDDGAQCEKGIVATIFTANNGWGACEDHATPLETQLAEDAGSPNVVRRSWYGCHVCGANTNLFIRFALDDTKYAVSGTALICDPDDNDCLAWYGVEVGR